MRSTRFAVTGIGKTSQGHESVSRRDREPQARIASDIILYRKKQQLAGGERGGFLEDRSVCEIIATVEVGWKNLVPSRKSPSEADGVEDGDDEVRLC